MIGAVDPIEDSNPTVDDLLNRIKQAALKHKAKYKQSHPDLVLSSTYNILKICFDLSRSGNHKTRKKKTCHFFKLRN